MPLQDFPEWGGKDWDWNWGQTMGGGPGGFATGAAQENVAAMPHISQLTQLVNSINQTAQQSANAGRIPGGRGLESQSSANIGQALRGQIDPSVIAQLRQGAAERGVGTGSPMGAGSNAAFLRALGLTTMDLMNTGQDWLTRATARNPAAPLFDPSSLFISPAQFGAFQMDRARLPRGGGGVSLAGPASGGGFSPGVQSAPSGGGMGVNWSDLFADTGGGGFSTPMSGGYYDLPMGNTIGGGGSFGAGGADVSSFYNPATNTLGADPFAAPVGTIFGEETSSYDPNAQFFDDSFYG